MLLVVLADHRAQRADLVALLDAKVLFEPVSDAFSGVVFRMMISFALADRLVNERLGAHSERLQERSLCQIPL